MISFSHRTYDAPPWGGGVRVDELAKPRQLPLPLCAATLLTCRRAEHVLRLALDKLARVETAARDAAGVVVAGLSNRMQARVGTAALRSIYFEGGWKDHQAQCGTKEQDKESPQGPGVHTWQPGGWAKGTPLWTTVMPQYEGQCQQWPESMAPFSCITSRLSARQ